MTYIEHTRTTLAYVRRMTDEVILFYSAGGKDSIVLVDVLAKNFNKVHCVFMYFVKDLEHFDPYIKYLKKYENVDLIQLPHFMLSEYLAGGYGYIGHSEKTKLIKLADIVEYSRCFFKTEWCFFGEKMADGLHRRLKLNGYILNSINENNKKCYPLSLWKKEDVLRYIELYNLIKPMQYTIGNSQGLTLTYPVLKHVKDNYPADFEKINKQFEIAEAILFNETENERIN